jgi:dTDP-4-dehydrorhamnose reductase
VRADAERRGSPTWVESVIPAAAAVARGGHTGLYHATAQGETSWADFARVLAGFAGCDPALVEALAYGALRMKAARPRRAILDNRRLRALGLDSLPDWKAQARAYVISESPVSPEPTPSSETPS